MPTSRPIAQSADPGNPAMMMAAIRISIRPATSSQDHRCRQFAAMLQRVHDGGDAFGEEIGADHDGQRQRALHRPRQQE